MATTITDATGLQNMKNDLTDDYELGNNINCSGIANFEPVGGWNGLDPFTGSFDGKHFTISHLTVNRPADDYIGLFGETDGATIQNVTLEDFTITGDDYVGTLVGNADISTFTNINVINTTVVGANVAGGLGGMFYGGAVTNCQSSGTVGNGYAIGGLLGYAGESGLNIIITDCHSSCTVSATDSLAGGLIGEAEEVTLLRCYATGNVTSTGDIVGGLCGWIGDGTASRCFATGNVTSTNVGGSGAGGLLGGLFGSITNCYSTGYVTAPDFWGRVGGLIGYTWNSFANEFYPSMVNCYSTGAVVSSNPALEGGFLGSVDVPDQTTTTNCFWDTETSGTARGVAGGNRTGVTGKTTAQMKDLNTILTAGWSIPSIWNVSSGCNSGYPCLVGVNLCCSSSAVPPADPTIAPKKVSLELIRNIEIMNVGRFYISKTGNAVYESRFKR